MLHIFGAARCLFCLPIAVGGLAFILFNTSAAAGAKKKGPLAWKPPSHVHMRAMMVPVERTMAPVTFYLEAVKPKRSEAICKRMPRIRDAILQALSRQPIRARKRRFVLKGVDIRLLRPTNKAVGKKYIRKIFITAGAVQVGAGKIKQRPYAMIDGCDNILRSEREREQARKAAAK